MSDKKSMDPTEFAANAKARAAEIGDAARAGAEAAYESMREQAEDGIDIAHRYMKKKWKHHPMGVAGAAVGVGVLIGLLLSSKRR